MKKTLVATRKKGFSFHRFRRLVYVLLFCLVWLAAAPLILKEFYHQHFTLAETLEQEARTLPEDESQEEDTPPEDASEEETQEDTEQSEESGESEETGALQFVTSEPDYFADALIIGDSRTVGLERFGTLTDADFFCEGGLAAHDILDGDKVGGYTLWETLAKKDYGKIYVMLGLNEVIFGVEEFKENFKQLYDTMREQCPDSLIFLMANLHVSAKVCEEQPGIGNDRLNAANSYIRTLADGRTSFYVDVNPLFDDENHCLPEDLSGDGIHVSPKSYIAWTEWLCTQTITEDSKPQSLVNFQQALDAVRAGSCVTRKEWGNPEVNLRLSAPVLESDDAEEVMPYIALKNEESRLVPWLASQGDLLAEDWIILN